MKKYILISILTLAVMLLKVADSRSDQIIPGGNINRFSFVDIMVNAGQNSISAYQFELKVTSGKAQLVGVEGGDCEAFSQPGMYDPKAMSNNRIKLADFNLEKPSPTGTFRIARLHFMITGDQEPQYQITPVVLADANGEKIKAELSLRRPTDVIKD